MIRRALLHTLLAIALVLSSLTAVVAETRMAAAGGYCGTDTPQLLLDAAGLPLLDGTGTAITAPDCPTCHLALTALTPTATYGLERIVAFHPATPVFPPSLASLAVHWDAQARAPPRTA